MSRFRPALLALLAGLTLAAAGCGGTSSSSSSGGSVPASASLVPPGAAVYVFGNTDFGGSQWSQLNSLLAKFPDEDLLTGMLRASLQKQGIDWDADVKPALGPETAATVLSLVGATTGSTVSSAKAVLMTQPKDAAKLDALIAKLDKTGTSSTPPVKHEIDGWTVVADSAASLARVSLASKGDSLADNADFKTAMGNLPDDALVKVYVDGTAVKAATKGGTARITGAGLDALKSLKSIAASVEATDSGIEAQAVIQGGTGAKEYKPALISDVPSGALVYLSFSDLGAQITKLTANPQLSPFLGQFQTALGVTPAQLAAMLGGEGALYVRAGSPLPEVTLVLAPDDAQAAFATLTALATRAAAQLGTTVESTTVGGVPAKRISVQGIPLYFAAVDGKLVVTDSETGITGLSSGGSKLADDPVFKEAKDAAGMPDETTGFLYVNVKDTVPLVDSFASLAGQSLPPQATSNLEHVRTFLAYGTESGDSATFKAFLEIK